MRRLVSLTTTAGRLAVVRYTLLSLLDQRTLADDIVLNVSRNPYLLDDGIPRAPDWLQDLENRGAVRVRWTPNTGPYRKLLPTLEECDDEDIVVTCDDDVIYEEDWLDRLLACADAHPEAIVCGHGRIPIVNLAGRLQSYAQWPRVSANGDYETLIPIGVAGVVYRRRLLDYDFLTWPEFLRVAPRQDDLWFKKASERRGTAVRIAPGADEQVHPISTRTALSDSNMTTRFRSEWGGLVGPMAERALFRLKAYAGFSVCENDRVWRAVERASEAFDAKAGVHAPGAVA